MAKHPNTPLGKVHTRFDFNIKRVRTLLSVPTNQYQFKDARMEVYRSAVVLLHATLEDVLRGLLAWKLPDAAAEHLADIHFDRKKTKAKIGVAELATHKGKMVDAYLGELIAAHLERESFNDIHDIVRTLRKLGFANDTFKSLLADLEPPMKRRHKIVHESDRIPADDHGHGTPRSISKGDVSKWIDDVEDFISSVLKRLQPKQQVARQIMPKQ